MTDQTPEDDQTTPALAPETAPAPPPMPGAPAVAARSSNGMAVAALVCGILSIVLFFTVWIPVILGILAIVFGAVGIGRANKGAPQKGLAIAGLVCGALGIAFAILFIVAIVRTVNDPEVQDIFTSIMQSISPGS